MLIIKCNHRYADSAIHESKSSNYQKKKNIIFNDKALKRI